MSLRREMKQRTDFTEREQDICKYILEHPEAVKTMSSRELGAAAFSSAAAVTRFCKKMCHKASSCIKGNTEGSKR